MQGTLTALLVAILQYIIVINIPTVVLQFDPFTFLVGNLQMLAILVTMYLIKPIKAMG